MMNDLLPCPFCGGEATLTEDYVFWLNEPLYAVMCQSLADWYETRFVKQHGGPPICGGTLGRAFSSESDAIAAWNRRAPTIPPDVRETLRGALQLSAGLLMGDILPCRNKWKLSDIDAALSWLDAQGE